LLPHFMSEFSKEFPGIQVQLMEDKTESLVKMLGDNVIDVAILSTPKRVSGNFYEKFLYNEPFVVYAAKGHDLLSRKVISFKSLESWEPVLLDETHCMRDQVGAICAMGKVDTGLSLRRGTLQTLLSVVEIQKGFTLIPWLMAETLVGAEAKHVRPIVSPAPCRKVGLMYHGTFVNRPLLEALHRVIVANLPSELVESKKAEKVISPAGHHF